MSVPLVEQNVFFLRQGAALLRRLPDEAYGPSETDGVPRAGVGPQFRHGLDFYPCLLRDLDKGQVGYDRRVRQESVEADRGTALSAWLPGPRLASTTGTGVARRSRRRARRPF